MGFCLGKTPQGQRSDHCSVIFKDAVTVTHHGVIGVRKLVHLFNFLCLEVIFTQSSMEFLKWGYPFPSAASWGRWERGGSPCLSSTLGLQHGTKEHLADT